MSDKPRVVVTGVSGFIGSALARRLIHDGYTVAGCDIAPNPGIDGLEFHSLDISLDSIEPFLRPGDVVVHLAAMTSLAACQQDPVGAAMVNVVGTVRVFDAAVRAGVDRVIYAETSAVYEGSDAGVPSREELHDDPESFYAVSKYVCGWLHEPFERYMGLKTVAVRPFNVYGPTQPSVRESAPLIAATIRARLDGVAPVIYGDGKKRRDFVFIDDVLDFLMLALTDDRMLGGTYNLGSGTNYSVAEVIDLIDAELGSSGGGYVTAPEREWEARETLADISAARALGWEPKVTLRDGIRRQIAAEQVRRAKVGIGGALL